jgi:aminodeoxyfutalosine synthase
MSRRLQVACDLSEERIGDPGLIPVAEKISSGERLDLGDAINCLKTRDLLSLGKLADKKRRAIHGEKATFIRNYHLNYTNICKNGCMFCAFHRGLDSPDGYLMSPEEAAQRVSQSPIEPLREVHIVGGCHPGVSLEYCVELLRAIKRARPEAHLKAFTAVEVDHVSRKEGISTGECLRRLKEAGLDAMPGGGAEVFSERLREVLFPAKIDAKRWLQIHAQAHELQIPTNATLLYGHLETEEERALHLLKLRDQQDRSRGFQAFIPLPFQPRNTRLSHLPGPTAMDTLRLVATARLVLDNFPSIKAYWVMMGKGLAQVALYFGADDLEGTIVQEKIAHEAGAETESGLTVEELEALIREAGLEPQERDTFHRPVGP